MINDTQLKHPAFLARIKAATVKAVHHAHRKGQGPDGVGYAMVHNRKGAPALLVVWRRANRMVEIFDKQDNEVTVDALCALITYHAKGEHHVSAF